MTDTIRSIIELALAAVVIPLLVANVAILLRLDRTLRQVHQTVYGVRGDNGLQAEVGRLRQSKHEHATLLQEHEFRLEGHDQTLTEIRGAP